MSLRSQYVRSFAPAIPLAALLWSAISPAAPPPGFISLDRVGPESRAELAFGTVRYPGEPSFAHRLDLYAQVSGEGGGGGYVAVPVSIADGQAEVGRAQLGGFYTTRGRLRMTFRGGLFFNAPDDGGLPVTAQAIPVRYSELVSGAGGEAWVRFSFSPQWSSRRVFLRGDFGVDAPFPGTDAGSRGLARANFGAGLRVAESVALTAELVTLGNLDGEPLFGGSRFLRAVTFGVRGGTGATTFFFGVSVPFDDVGGDPTLSLIGGLQYHF